MFSLGKTAMGWGYTLTIFKRGILSLLQNWLKAEADKAEW